MSTNCSSPYEISDCLSSRHPYLEPSFESRNKSISLSVYNSYSSSFFSRNISNILLFNPTNQVKSLTMILNKIQYNDENKIRCIEYDVISKIKELLMKNEKNNEINRKCCLILSDLCNFGIIKIFKKNIISVVSSIINTNNVKRGISCHEQIQFLYNVAKNYNGCKYMIMKNKFGIIKTLIDIVSNEKIKDELSIVYALKTLSEIASKNEKGRKQIIELDIIKVMLKNCFNKENELILLNTCKLVWNLNLDDFGQNAMVEQVIIILINILIKFKKKKEFEIVITGCFSLIFIKEKNKKFVINNGCLSYLCELLKRKGLDKIVEKNVCLTLLDVNYYIPALEFINNRFKDEKEVLEKVIITN